ncbi:hypothetical protein H9P43_002144 [Blastocladiella emersonii ATCC 22665]|nr:hypothetical protein H9P43_002144 [Blastocladiella emersonii ATCC 22665]
MPEVAKIAREVVSSVVLERSLSYSVSSKTYHHQTLHNKMIERRAMWREEAGMPEEDLKHSLAARGDPKKSTGRDYVAQAKALVESLDKRFAEEFHDRLPRMRFMVEVRERRWWSELAYSLRDAVVMVGCNLHGFGMVSSKLKAPVKTMIRELRAAGIPVYLVEENYSSKWCAACFFADPTADNETFNLTGKSYKTRTCRTCGVRVQRDRNAAVNIFGFALGHYHFVRVAPQPKSTSSSSSSPQVLPSSPSTSS